MKITLLLMTLLTLTACGSEKVEVLKSPCVGLDDSPCGPKRPANDWWLKKPQQA
ncbi:MAG: hypothetical protein ACOYJ2_07840 [Rickettsiales bacterium]